MSDLRGQADDGGELYTDDVSRAYRLAAGEEPSPALDDAIHAAALRAAGSRPRPLPRGSLRRWGIPIAVAATIVIGVSIAFLAADRPDSALAPLAEAPGSRRPEPKQSAPMPGVPPESTDRVLSEVPKLPPGVAGGQAPVTAAAREARPSRERTTRDEFVGRREQAVVPAAPSESLARPDALTDATKGVSKVAPGVDPLVDQDAESPSPEVWLQRIRELRNKGQTAQADESLLAFRRRYPDYPLPADVPPPTQIGK